MEVLALTRTNIEGTLVVVAAMVLFAGGTYVLASAIMGRTLGYLVTATGFFAFMVILSALWTFGAPGTPRFLGPKGDLPLWVPLTAGGEIRSPTYPAVERYPGEPWVTPEDDPAFAPEAEAAELAFQEFLAEEATAELREFGIEGEAAADAFVIEGLRFTEVDGRPLAVARAFATTGGPEVVVFGYKDPGNEGLPSYLFLAGSVIGFVAHLPFLDRAERRRKEVLTGGDQAPWRGPA